jgi:sulfofructose kinase
MEKQWDIIGIGSAAVDDLLFLDRFPMPDEKIPVRAKLRRCGGQTSTALVAAARHGAKVAFCSCFGEDELSEYLLHALEREGVDCSLSVKSRHCLPIHSNIIIDSSSGSRTVLFHSSGFREPSAEMVMPEWISSSRLVFIDQNTPASGIQAALYAQQYGIPVIADLEFKSSEQANRLLSLVDHLIVGVDFARQATEKTEIQDMVDALSSENRTACVVTWGSKGCWYSFSGQAPVHFPAIPVSEFDTTGCGDVFHGVYAAAVARGESLHRAVTLASAAGALKATNTNGWAGIPTLGEIEDLLQQPHG